MIVNTTIEREEISTLNLPFIMRLIILIHGLLLEVSSERSTINFCHLAGLW